MAAANETGAMQVALVEEPRTQPAWCEDIPAEHRAEACGGSGGGCACQGWCKEQVPAFTWKWVPGCCACAGGEEEAQPELGVAALAAVGAASGWRMPSWCGLVPPGERHSACRGSRHGCSCHGWCRNGVPRFSWHLNPECCAC